MESFSPRNGEIILKTGVDFTSKQIKNMKDFSPRNGEIILKGENPLS